MNYYVPGQVPHQIQPRLKTGDRLRVQHRAGVGVQNVDPFAPARTVEVHRIQGDQMRPARQVQIEAERARRVPRRGNLAPPLTCSSARASLVEASQVNVDAPFTVICA